MEWDLRGQDRKKQKQQAKLLQNVGFDGDFFVRDVDSRPGDVGMCLRTNRTGKHAIANFLIRKTSNGTFKLDATSKEFPSLRKLLHYYATEKRSALPVKLTMLEDGWDADSPATPRRRGSKGPEDYKSGGMDADQPPMEGAPWKRDPKKDLGRRDHLSAAARRHANEVQRQSIALDSDLQAVRMLSDNPDAAEAHLAVLRHEAAVAEARVRALKATFAHLSTVDQPGAVAQERRLPGDAGTAPEELGFPDNVDLEEQEEANMKALVLQEAQRLVAEAEARRAAEATAAERAAKHAAEMAVLALEEQRSQQTELARQQLAMEREKLALERQALEAALATQKAEAEMLESQKNELKHRSDFEERIRLSKERETREREWKDQVEREARARAQEDGIKRASEAAEARLIRRASVAGRQSGNEEVANALLSGLTSTHIAGETRAAVKEEGEEAEGPGESITQVREKRASKKEKAKKREQEKERQREEAQRKAEEEAREAERIREEQKRREQEERTRAQEELRQAQEEARRLKEMVEAEQKARRQHELERSQLEADRAKLDLERQKHARNSRESFGVQRRSASSLPPADEPDGIAVTLRGKARTNGPSPPTSGGVKPAPSGGACTFLGNCTCPNCQD